MKIKNTLLGVLIALSFIATAEVNASCSFSGKIERIITNSSGTYVYLVPLTSIANSYYYYFKTDDDTKANAAHSAKDGNSYVKVTGSSSSCPSTSVRYGGIISSITRY